MFAVIAAYSRSSQTSERKMLVGDLYHGIVYAPTAKGIFSHDFPLKLFVAGKKVQSQWIAVLSNVSIQIRFVFIGYNGQDRPEDLIPHKGAFHGGFVHQGWLQKSIFVIETSPADKVLAFKHRFKSFVLLCCGDPRKVRGFFNLLSIESGDIGL